MSYPAATVAGMDDIGEVIVWRWTRGSALGYDHEEIQVRRWGRRWTVRHIKLGPTVDTVCGSEMLALREAARLRLATSGWLEARADVSPPVRSGQDPRTAS